MHICDVEGDEWKRNKLQQSIGLFIHYNQKYSPYTINIAAKLSVP